MKWGDRKSEILTKQEEETFLKVGDYIRLFFLAAGAFGFLLFFFGFFVAGNAKSFQIGLAMIGVGALLATIGTVIFYKMAKH